MTASDHKFPEDIFWAELLVMSRMRTAAFLRPDTGVAAKPGATRAWLADIPVDAQWAPAPTSTERHGQYGAQASSWPFSQSPYDGPCCYLQLNLEEIPADVRQNEYPSQGVVWVMIDLSGEPGWEACAHYDPRPAESIPWRPRMHDDASTGMKWHLESIAPDCTEETMPELVHYPFTYEQWAQEHNRRARKSDIQVGGWIWPCQGDFDVRNRDFVCGIEHQTFGDSGAIYLHYNKDRGFYARVETH